jgi:hypothetical protein
MNTNLEHDRCISRFSCVYYGILEETDNFNCLGYNVSYEGEGGLDVKSKFNQNSGNYRSHFQTIISVWECGNKNLKNSCQINMTLQ